MAVDIGPKIGIDGEAQFRKEINGIIQQSKTLASEMKAVTSAFDKNDKSQEAVTAQSKVLTKQIETQQQRIAKLKEGLEAATKKFGEADSRTQKWQQAVNEATAGLNKMNKDLSDLENGVDGVGDAMEAASKDAASFGDVLKANVLGQVIVDGIKEVASAIKDMSGEFLDAAADIKAEASQFDQTFGEFGSQASEAIGAVAKSADILDSRLKPVGTQIYAFARASGGDATQSLDLMKKALQATADNAAYYDRSLKDSAESLQSFLKGNYENDAALGLSATETTRNAAAMEIFGEKFKDLSEIQKQETLLQMVLDAQELSGAMGQASREADGWENVQGNLNESWRQFMAAAGDPILENLIPIVQGITDELVKMTQNIDWNAFGEAIDGFVQGIVDNGTYIVSTIAGIGSGFVAWNVAAMIQGVVKTITDLGGILPAIQTGITAINTAMKANAIGIIITLIAGVITAIVTLWNTNEDFRNAVIEIGNSIKEAVSNVVKSVVDFFTVKIPSAFRSMVQTIKDNVNVIKNAFSNMVNSIKSTVGNIKSAVVDGIRGAVDYIKGLPGQAIGWGKDFIQGFVDGIQGMIGSVVNAVSNVANTVKSWLHFSRPDVGPLREYEEWMPDMMMGLSKGIRDNSWRLEDALNAATSNLQANVNVASLPAASGGMSMGGVNITINPAPGMDVDALAERVAYKLETMTRRKAATW